VKEKNLDQISNQGYSSLLRVGSIWARSGDLFNAFLEEAGKKKCGGRNRNGGLKISEKRGEFFSVLSNNRISRRGERERRKWPEGDESSMLLGVISQGRKNKPA